MSGGGNPRSLAGWLSRVGANLRGTLDYSEFEHAGGAVHPSRALPRFLAAMRLVRSPALVDLGPVTGQNVAFLGSHLGCKLYLDDVFGDIERLTREHRESAIPAALADRLTYAEASIDGVLCWDVFDYLDAAAASALAARLARILKPGGIGMAQFSTVRSAVLQYHKYIMVDPEHLEHRSIPAVRPTTRLWSSRDVQRLFNLFEIDESFLLVHRQRETLFHKGLAPAGGR